MERLGLTTKWIGSIGKMNRKMWRFQIKKNSILLVLLSMVLYNLPAQNYSSYRKDSLQIKVYAQIEYIESKVKNIKITKVFCDYCTDYQKEALKYEAHQRVSLEAYFPDFLVKNGKRKQALNIRVSKRDFAVLKKEGELMNTEKECINNN